ncbi:MAG: hypothetical protein ABI807_04030 [Sporichthyaceae bacterium]
MPEAEAASRAQRLAEIGFIEVRDASFWVQFHYRSGLKLRQGAAV